MYKISFQQFLTIILLELFKFVFLKKEEEEILEMASV